MGKKRSRSDAVTTAPLPKGKAPKRKTKGSSDMTDENQSQTLQKEKLPAKPEDKDAAPWSKSKKKRMRRLQAKAHEKSKKKGAELSSKASTTGGEKDELALPTPAGAPSASKRGSDLQNSFKARLAGSRFRILNEELYTTTSQGSFSRFSENPELFEQYHEGFRRQVESWPVNPVDLVVKWLLNHCHRREKENNETADALVVADFGCGDAQLAKDLGNIRERKKKGSTSTTTAAPFVFHSFDLVSQNDLVTAADMANVPLEKESVDVCVFCLSLMGTNLADFIREAHRVLKDSGRLKIVEVRSRIEYCHSKKGKNKPTKDTKSKNKSDSKGGAAGAAGTLEEFKNILSQLGFKCLREDKTNKMFVTLELKKSGKNPDRHLHFSAKPCIYKIR